MTPDTNTFLQPREAPKHIDGRVNTNVYSAFP
jgi:hypothetical protein